MLAPYRHASLALQLLVLPAALLVGCVVSKEDTNTPIQTSSNGSTTTTSSGAGGAGGDGGQGGQGGGCVTADGTNQTVAACEEINIAPAQGASQQCGPGLDEDPIGYRVCKRGFDIFAAGHAEDLVLCLGSIGVQDACDVPPAADCISKMYDNACVSGSIGDTCEGLATSCGQPIDKDGCVADLNPFSEVGLNELVDCINAEDPALSCQEAYDACYPQIMTF